MLQKTVGCWRYGYWQKLTLLYEPLPKGGIAPEQHPAVIEDMELYADVSIANPNHKNSWKQGALALTIIRYLRFNGPSLVSEIAEDLEGNAPSITRILKDNPQLFKPLPTKRPVFAGNGRTAGAATVWTVNTEAEN